MVLGLKSYYFFKEVKKSYSTGGAGREIEKLQHRGWREGDRKVTAQGVQGVR